MRFVEVSALASAQTHGAADELAWRLVVLKR
jgi:hypothetical protein